MLIKNSKLLISLILIANFYGSLQATRECYVLVRGVSWLYGQLFSNTGKIFRALQEQINQRCGGEDCYVILTTFDCDSHVKQSYHRGLLSGCSAMTKLDAAKELAYRIIQLKNEQHFDAVHLITYGPGIDISAMASQLLNFQDKQRRELRCCQVGVQGKHYGTDSRSFQMATSFLEGRQHLHDAWRGAPIHRSPFSSSEESVQPVFVESIATISINGEASPVAADINYQHDDKTVKEVLHIIPPSEECTVPTSHPAQQTAIVNPAQSGNWFTCCMQCMSCTRDVVTSEAAQEIAKLALRIGVAVVTHGVLA